MSNLKRALAGLTLGLGVVAHVGASTVDLTVDGQWHPFDVDNFSSISGGLEWIDLVGDTLSFQINNVAPVVLTVVDGGFAGDIFDIKDNGVSLGLSSPASNTYPVSVGTNFDAAMLDGAYSKAAFTLAPGNHTITGLLSVSALDDTSTPLDATVGAVMLQAVPEPSQWAMLLAGFGMLTLVTRRRVIK